MQNKIRNFCIIAHIDHGKSTLADRFLEFTKTIDPRKMKAQVLDQLDLERERGITIKLQPVRMNYNYKGEDYILNLIDTPGHVDFSYEVSRSIACCEGAILVVDAAQGIQAQTLSTIWMAREHKLKIIPVVNKIDLPAAEPEKVALEIEKFLGISANDVVFCSAKTGEGIEDIIQAVIERVPAPTGNAEAPTKALVFDAVYDSYRGVVAYVRVFDGSIKHNEPLKLVVTGSKLENLEVGYFKPQMTKSNSIQTGEIGYIVTGLKDLHYCHVGDTVTSQANPVSAALPGYKKVNSFVYAGIFPVDTSDYPQLRDALEKLSMNDASLVYEPENSPALGSGFRCGFLGLLHMEIVQERLEREHGLNLLITAPSVSYSVKMKNGKTITVHSPVQLPEPDAYLEIFEPWTKVEIIVPVEYVGAVMRLAEGKRGIYINTTYISDEGTSLARALLEYEIPMAEVIINFYDELKSLTRGYGSLNYDLIGERAGDLVKLDVFLAKEKVDALARIVHASKAQAISHEVAEKLKESIPKQMFEIAIQVGIGTKILSRETIPAMRKDVIAKLYGGDVTRKRKLLEKQKEGKKKMKAVGGVEIPKEAFIALLRK